MRERGNELHHAREIIQRLQRRDAVHGGKDSVATAPPLSSLSTISSTHTTTVGATVQFEPQGRTVPLVIESNQARTHDLVIGYDFQIRD